MTARLRAWVVAMVAVALGTGCTDPAPRPPGVLYVSVEQHAAWIRSFNPLGAANGARFPARGGIYETLLIFNAIKDEWTPWLATDYEWSDDALGLRFTIREGVKWSDGKPFTADDVAFTFALLKEHRALDVADVWSFLESVEAPSPDVVEMRFSRAYVPGLAEVAHHPIVAKHIWKDIDDPVTFANPNPVGTGPFTEVTTFRSQVYEIERNPHYWQPGKPAVKALRFRAYPSNDQANVAIVQGEVDWGGNFVPAVDRTYVARDPEHNHYWFPPLGPAIFVYPNTTQAPFDDVRVRKALSRAIDRERIVEIAMYGMTHASDATGLGDVYASWRDPDLAKDPWVQHDKEAAARMLDEAGCHLGDGGIRRCAGKPMRFDMIVVNGWSDWVRAGQVLSRDLASLGVEVSLRPLEFTAWYTRVQQGDFEMALAWSMEGPTPYGFYKWMMSPRTVMPVGKAAAGNWHRFGDEEADELLRQFEGTTDPAKQRELMRGIQARFVETAPAVPLFPNPLWGLYSTKRFEGFPNADDPYAKLSPHSDPERLLVLTRVRPREDD